MDAFVKSFATYRTIKKASAISSALTLDSLDAENSTVTVVGTDIGRGNTGDWLIIDGLVYLISAVKPQNDRTMLTLHSPLDAFSRPLELGEDTNANSVGGFVASRLQSDWIGCEDPVYAMPYLLVSNSDTTPYSTPELDDSGCFVLSEYCRLMRKSYRVHVRFIDAGKQLVCVISKSPATARQVSFTDGRSQIQSVDYSASGTAKITALHDIDSGEKDENGDAILIRERSEWYLSESGEITQSIPPRRASGGWAKISVKGNADVESKVREAFAKNKANHKLEFWSELDLAIQDECTFHVYGELLHSYISYKRKSSEDRRYYYKSGELATTAAEKMRGVTK